jgi:hypothetical protein
MTTADEVGVTGSTDAAVNVAVPLATGTPVAVGAMLEAAVETLATAEALMAGLMLLLTEALLKRL